MDTYKTILDRANLQQIASFLISGSELKILDPYGPVQRAETAQQKLDTLLEEAISDCQQLDEILSAANETYSVTEYAYLELGLSAAFRMLQP